jgi:hypothetical protein
MAGARIPTLISSVGRVELDGELVGTRFVVAPGLVMTNRHVLEELVIDPTGQGGWTFRPRPEVNFKAEFDAPDRLAFRISEVIFAPPARIGETVDLESSISRCSPSSSGMRRMPHCRSTRAGTLTATASNLISL